MFRLRLAPASALLAALVASAAPAEDPAAGENATGARPVAVRATQRGGLAFPGGEIDFSVHRPGWHVCPLRADWDAESADGSRRFEILGESGETLFRGRSAWSRGDGGAVAGRVEIECVRAARMQCLALSASVPAEPPFGLGDGAAAAFDLPLSDGRSLRLSFPEPVACHSQDSRRWFGQWTVRFGGHLGHDGTRDFVPGERLAWDMVLSAPDGLALDLARPLDIVEGEDWVRLDYRKDIVPGSALDFSGMGLQNAPAGKHGWLKAVGGRFEFEGLPGAEQRFYGVNLCFSANFPEHDLADRLVDRLVRSGYNAIRVHHHDGAWAKAYALRANDDGALRPMTNDDNLVIAANGGSVTAGAAGSSLRGTAAPVIAADVVSDDIDKLDYLLAKCFERGLYVTTDLYVSRPVAWREIGIDRDGTMPNALYKTYVGIHDGAFADWCKWAQAFLGHVNPYTGRAYRDEPGMPLLSLVNEGKLDESLAASDDPVIGEARKRFNERGGGSFEAFDDWLNAGVWERCAGFLRSIGCRALLTNDNSGRRHGEGEGTTPLLDYVDSHTYVDHPVFLEQPWRLPFKCLNTNPIRDDRPAIFHRGWSSAASSKPCTITEWNFSGPGRFRGMGGVLVGAFAAAQDWDGLWRFAYSHDRRNLLDGGRGSLNFDLAEDPLLAASDRAGVCLYLRRDAQVEADAANDRSAKPTMTNALCASDVGVERQMTNDKTKVIAPKAPVIATEGGSSLPRSGPVIATEGGSSLPRSGPVIAAGSGPSLRGAAAPVIEDGGRNAPAVFALDTSGRRAGVVPSRVENGVLRFTASTRQPFGGCLHYEIVREGLQREVSLSTSVRP